MRKFLAIIAIAVGMVIAVVTPASAAGTVTNSCAVSQALHARMPNGELRFVQCGQSLGNVSYVSAGPRPYFVKLSGTAPKCMQAGHRFYLANVSAVITPTVRC